MKQILGKGSSIRQCRITYAWHGSSPRQIRFRYYGESSAWWNMLFVGGYEFLNPPPQILDQWRGVKPFAQQRSTPTPFAHELSSTRRQELRLRCVMRLANGSVPSTLLRIVDARRGNPFDGSKTYKVVLPKDIPAARFWSFTVYDNQSRSMLQTPQRFPRAGSQSYPSPAATLRTPMARRQSTSARNNLTM